MKVSININKLLKKYGNEDWVVIREGSPVRFYRNPANNKAPTSAVNSLAEDEEILRISYAKKMGKL